METSMRTSNVTILLMIVLVVSAGLAGANKRIIVPPGTNLAGTIPADFDADVKQMNVDYLRRMRERLARWLSEIVDKYPPRIPVDVEELADHLNVVVEGAIIQSKALRDESLMGKQTRLFRNHIKLLFGA